MPKLIENLKEDILSKSLEIIESEGVDSLSIRRLSSQLGIAPSTIYNYYSSKEHILGALARARFMDALAVIDGRCDRDRPAETFAMMVDELRATAKPFLIYHIAAVRASSQKFDEEYGEHESNRQFIFDQLTERVRAMLPPGGDDTDRNAEIITRLIIGCMHDDNMNFMDIASAMKAL